MYDQRLNRNLTDADLPPGFKVKTLEAFLKQHGLSFFALGDIPAEGSTEWRTDPSVFRVGTHSFPSRGQTIRFSEIAALVQAGRLLPDIKEPSVQAGIAESAQTAYEVLSNSIRFAEGAEDHIVLQLTHVIDAILRGKEYSSRDFPLRSYVKDWPSDYDDETPGPVAPSI